MFKIDQLMVSARDTQKEIDGKWVPCRPIVGPLIYRLKDAWEVVRGRADAVRWHKQ